MYFSQYGLFQEYRYTAGCVIGR